MSRYAADVRRLAGAAADLPDLDGPLTVCRACPRLVEWREQVAREKRAAYRDEPYWGRPIAGFGPGNARIAVVGLAPAAHGGNRTGRVFTGDRSGDWLFAAFNRAGLAILPTSTHVGDGQALIDTRVLATVRCAPPANRPMPDERETCRPWMDRELELLAPTLRVVIALGGYAWNALWPTLDALSWAVPRPRPRFGHGAEVVIGGLTVIGCFHPSQQNTFTGRLTEPMLDAVLGRAAALAGLEHSLAQSEPGRSEM